MSSENSNYIIVQAYGDAGIIAEAKYLLLSFIARNVKPLAEVIIYTDQPLAFELYQNNLNISYAQLDSNRLKDWRGSIDFVHRVKIEILMDATFSRKGNFLYLDSDTVLLQPLDEVFNSIAGGKVFMHLNEGKISDAHNPVLKKLNDFIQSGNVSGDARPILEALKSSTNIEMWNAGVLGFNSERSYVLGQVLRFTDLIYAAYPKHIVEQLAFSYYLQTQFSLLPAQSLIYHYWNLKEFRTLLIVFFGKYTTLPEQLMLMRKINPGTLIQAKQAYEKENGLVKAWKRLRGSEWKIPSLDLLITDPAQNQA